MCIFHTGKGARLQRLDKLFLFLLHSEINERIYGPSTKQTKR